MTWGDRLKQVLPPILVAIGFIAVWQAFVKIQDIKPFLLPAPSLVWDQLKNNWDQIWKATKATGMNALVGLAVGTFLGILMALISSRFKIFTELTLPLSAAINAMPIIALAPMFNNMFSTTSAIPRRLIVTIIVFFPIFVNVLKGLRQVEPTQLELMRSYAAPDLAVQRKVRIPNALPFLFTGLKLAASLCVIAAVVAEYFGGLQNGLGSRITSAAANSAYGRAWAYVVAACGLGLAFYVATVVLERLAMPWNRRRAAT
jgi:NitT/TauT family transport system permease protein